jgi:hypothetical protein
MRFLEEGYASYWQGGCWYDPYTRSLDELVGVTLGELIDLDGHARSGHLMTYIAGLHGEAKVLELKAAVRPGGSVEDFHAGFESVMGESFVTFESRMKAETPHRLCSGELAWADATLGESAAVRLEATVDCDAADTLGPFDSIPSLGFEFEVADVPYAVRILEVPRTTDVTLVLDAPPGSEARLYPGDCGYGYDPIAVQPGAALAVTLDACRWYVALVGIADQVSDVVLTVSPEAE